MAGPVVGSPQGSSTESVISRFLVPSVGTPSGPKIAPPKARLLTSIDALAILEEKEQKKQQEAEEKEQRKKEREAKRLDKQEECKRKAAERARKAEERAEEKTRKAEEKARKAEEKTWKAEEKAQKTNASSVRPGVRLKKRKANESTDKETTSPPEKRTRTAEQEVIDTNICCVCFTSFEEDALEQTGLEWVACECGRWLHEDCAEDCIQDESGNDRLCPFCIDVLS